MSKIKTGSKNKCHFILLKITHATVEIFSFKNICWCNLFKLDLNAYNYYLFNCFLIYSNFD